MVPPRLSLIISLVPFGSALLGSAFDLKQIVYRQIGVPDTLDFRIDFEYDKKPISPWHDIPLRDKDFEVLHFICEIPKHTSAKMEIQKEVNGNPIQQDTKTDKKTFEKKLRYYKYPAEKPESIVNYGALPQTFEDPEAVDPITGLLGDGDPIDAFDVDATPCSYQGEVKKVRVLGALGLIDGGETDWKVIVRNVESSKKVVDEELMKTVVPAAREWFRMYKTAEGKGENKFAKDGHIFSASEALQIVQHTHKMWQSKFMREEMQKSGRREVQNDL